MDFATADIASYIGAIMASFVAAWLGLDKLKRGREAEHHDDAEVGQHSPGNGNEKIRAQVYKVLRQEKVLDRQAHDDLCDGRIKLVLQQVETQGKAVAGLQTDMKELLRRIPGG